MARSPKYWYDIMIAEKNTYSNLNVYQPNIDSSQNLLDNLTTTSKVANWRLRFWAVACAHAAFDVVLDLYKLFLESIAAKSRYGTLPWYITVAKEFQYGDPLVLVDSEWKYAVLDETKQIIDLAAAQEAVGIVNVKIATLSGSTPVPVGVPQLAAFTTYINQKKPAGIVVNVINEVADDLKLYVTVNFDPQVMTSTGELIASPGTYPVEDAINDYLNSFGSDSNFNSAFEIASCQDKIQAALGVVSPYITNAQARYGVNPFLPFTERYFPNAGYLQIDAGTPLNTTITYVPYV
jgi:hypothetical protein